MNETEISLYITETFEGVDFVNAMDATFFFYNPDEPKDHMYPFATIVTNDLHDQFSDLNRPNVFRLNVGVKRETWLGLESIGAFAGAHKPDSTGSDIESQYDFTMLDQLLPHPVYYPQHWVSVLNPSDETFNSKIVPLLDEAYQMAVKRRKAKKLTE